MSVTKIPRGVLLLLLAMVAAALRHNGIARPDETCPGWRGSRDMFFARGRAFAHKNGSDSLIGLRSVMNFCMKTADLAYELIHRRRDTGTFLPMASVLKNRVARAPVRPSDLSARLLVCLSDGYPLPAGNRRGSSTSSPRPLHVVSTSVHVRSTSVHVTSTIDPCKIHVTSVSVHDGRPASFELGRFPVATTRTAM